MKVLLLTDGIWPNTIGGMQKHSFYLIKYLAQNQIHVEVLHPHKEAKKLTTLFSFDELLFLKFHYVEMPLFKIKFPGHYLFSNYFYSKKLYKKVKEFNDFYFIYCQGFTAWYLVKNGIKVGSNLHGLEMFQKTKGFKSKLIQYLLRIPAKKIIKNSAISFSLGGKLTNILTENNAQKVIETPIGIGENWLEKVERYNNKIKFLFVGRNEFRKGVKYIFEALKNISIQKFTFEFIGIENPTDFKDNRCKFYGEIKDECTIQEIMKKSDILVCPSLSEGMPTVILEAMSKSMSIIATDVGATSMLVSSENGFLINPDNTNELIESITKILNLSKFELENLQKNSFEKVSKNFTWTHSIKKTISAIESGY